MDDGRTDGRSEIPADVAAEQLGISRDALRKRISRGTVAARKVDGAWMVTLEPSEPGRTRPRTDADSPPPAPTVRPGRESPNDALVARLESENTFLRQQVERQTHIIAGLIQRIPDLQEIAAGEIIVAEELRAESAPKSAEPGNAAEAQNLAPLRDDGRDMTNVTLNQASDAPRPGAGSHGLGWRRWWRRIIGGG